MLGQQLLVSHAILEASRTLSLLNITGDSLISMCCTVLVFVTLLLTR